MTAKRICLGSIIWMAFTTLVVFIPNVSPWLATPFVLIGLIFVLGLLWAINLKINSDDILEYVLYVIGLGLGFLLLGGLGINWLLPHLGIAQPLAKLPLIIFFDASALALSVCAYFFNKNYIWSLKPLFARGDGAHMPDRTSLLSSLFFGIVPLLFVVASVCGAEILNNGGQGTLTLVMLFGIAVYVLALMIWGKSVQGWTYASAIYFISLSLLLMYSLRSSHIFGWDINQEYQVFQMTLQNLRWKMSYYPGLDYNACMSITILPTIFKELTNIASEYVFKVTFQLLFAIVPVMVYALAKRYLKESLAFLAAFLLVSQSWFFEQLPALIRQETAFIFFMGLILVLFDERLSSRARYILFYLFTIGLIISHYSTAYVWFALMFVVLVLGYANRLFIRSLRRQPMVLKPMMLVVSLVLLFIWQVPLTQTVGTVTNFLANKGTETSIATSTASSSTSVTAVVRVVKVTAVAAVVPVVAPLVAVKDVLFASANPDTTQNLLVAERVVTTKYGAAAGYSVYPNASTSNYAATTINDGRNVTQKLPQGVSSVINLLARLDKLLLIDLFPLLGILAMYLAFRRKPSAGTYDFILLSIGAFFLIVLILLVPYLQVYYNFTRLYLQMFLILSTMAIVGGVMVTKYVPRYQMIVLALMVVIIFCSLNGAFDQLTGGPARMTLDQPPGELDLYYIHDTEVAGARWLATNRNPDQPVQADIVAGLRLQSFANISAFNLAIFPQIIERNSYVYLINENIANDESFYEYENNVLTYNYPLAFLDSHKNLIYNDGGSRVYR